MFVFTSYVYKTKNYLKDEPNKRGFRRKRYQADLAG